MQKSTSSLGRYSRISRSRTQFEEILTSSLIAPLLAASIPVPPRPHEVPTAPERRSSMMHTRAGTPVHRTRSHPRRRDVRNRFPLSVGPRSRATTAPPASPPRPSQGASHRAPCEVRHPGRPPLVQRTSRRRALAHSDPTPRAPTPTLSSWVAYRRTDTHPLPAPGKIGRAHV